MKKILLVAPEFEVPGQRKAFVVPLHLATLAALTPDDIEVDLWDETVQVKPLLLS